MVGAGILNPTSARRGLNTELADLLGRDAVVSGDHAADYLHDQTQLQGLSGRAERGMAAVFSASLAIGGTVSGEPGLGWVKRLQLDRQFQGVEADLQVQLKSIFDPLGLLNPGKQVPRLDVGGAT